MKTGGAGRQWVERDAAEFCTLDEDPRSPHRWTRVANRTIALIHNRPPNEAQIARGTIVAGRQRRLRAIAENRQSSNRQFGSSAADRS